MFLAAFLLTADDEPAPGHGYALLDPRVRVRMRPRLLRPSRGRGAAPRADRAPRAGCDSTRASSGCRWSGSRSWPCRRRPDAPRRGRPTASSDRLAASGLRRRLWEHWLGTDRQGRDVWSRVVWGSQVTLLIGVTAVVVGGVRGRDDRDRRGLLPRTSRRRHRPARGCPAGDPVPGARVGGRRGPGRVAREPHPRARPGGPRSTTASSARRCCGSASSLTSRAARALGGSSRGVPGVTSCPTCCPP